MGCLALTYQPVFEAHITRNKKTLRSGNTVLKRRSKYVFGHQGVEKVNEVAGIGNHYTAFFGEYSPRDVHRWNRDPKPVAWESPYSMYRGNPIWYADPLLDYSRVGAMWRNFVHGGNGITKTFLRDGEKGKTDWGYTTTDKEGDAVFHFGNKGKGSSFSVEKALGSLPIWDLGRKIQDAGDKQWRVPNKEWYGGKSWEGDKMWKEKGWPTTKATVGVLATVTSAGTYGAFITTMSAADIAVGGIGLGLGSYSTASDVKEAATGRGLPGGDAAGKAANALDAWEVIREFNPLGAIGLGMTAVDRYIQSNNQ